MNQSSKTKFVFYDLETTGISPAFDQPLQFAAIVTDLELNEIERIDIRCQLSPHILPAPKALAVYTNLRDGILFCFALLLVPSLTCG